MNKLIGKSEQAQRLQTSFVSILVEDVIESRSRREASDTQASRRDLIRALFAAVEGLVWAYREHITDIARSSGAMTRKEELTFAEMTYLVTPQGKIVEQVRYVPLLGMIRLTTRLAERINPKLVVDFGNSGWSSLKLAIEVRNRVTHPKSAADLEISPDDLLKSQAAFNWLFELVLGAMEAANIAHKNYVSQFRKLLGDLKSGDPETWSEYRTVMDSGEY